MRRAGPAAARLSIALWLGVVAAAPAWAGADGFVATLWDDWSLADAMRCNRLVRDMGAQGISFLVHLRQRDRRSAQLRWAGAGYGTPLERTAWRDTLRAAIADAHRLGLAVTLIPFVRTDAGQPRQGLWPRDRAAWFRSYGTRLLELARLAQREGVEELLVGSELTLLFQDEGRWRDLIARVRAVFSGHLTASAQFWTYPSVRFWDVLDSVGVSAYFPLAPWRGLRSVALFERAWRLHEAVLLAYCAALGKPLTFCEVGYPSTDVAALMPWDFRWSRRRRDVALQARCFEALRRVWGRQRRLRRLAIWGLEPPGRDARWRGGKGFDPVGKPAEAVVRRLLRERAGR